VLFRSVEDMSHADSFQIFNVADGLPVADNNAGTDLVTIDSHLPAVMVVAGGSESGHYSVFLGSGMNNGIDQFVSGSFARYTRGFQAQVPIGRSRISFRGSSCSENSSLATSVF